MSFFVLVGVESCQGDALISHFGASHPCVFLAGSRFSLGFYDLLDRRFIREPMPETMTVRIAMSGQLSI
jgi:hypothetical protein